MGEKQLWKPGNMLYPLPAVMVTTGDRDGNYNIMTAAWAGTICSDPPMVYVSVRKSRYTHHMIDETGEYFINLTTQQLAYATDFCGVKSGRDINKFEVLHLTPKKGMLKYAPMIEESPVCIACRVNRILELGSHDMFMADVAGVYADEDYMDKNGRFSLERAEPIVYSHGEYYGVGKHIGRFGYSVKKAKGSRRK